METTIKSLMEQLKRSDRAKDADGFSAKYYWKGDTFFSTKKEAREFFRDMVKKAN